MEALQRAFEPYRHLDPSGWVGVFRQIPAWAGAICIVLGTLMLFFGRGHLFRLVAGPLGATIGLIWVASVITKLGISAPVNQVTIGSAFALAVLGLLYPPGVVFFAFGIPAGLLAGHLVGPVDWLLAFVPAFVIGGALGLLLHTVVSSVLSSVAGAWVLTLGLMAVLNPLVPAVGTLAHNPTVVLCIAACFAIGGAVYQLIVRGSPEALEKEQRERQLARQKAKEDKALAKRWASYTKNSRKKGG